MKDTVDFIFNNSALYKESQRSELFDEIEKHNKYGTLCVIYDDKGIKCVGRWNTKDWVTFYVIDVIIRKGLERHGILKEMILWGKKRFPTFQYILFERGLKNKGFRIYNINRMLKGDN